MCTASPLRGGSGGRRYAVAPFRPSGGSRRGSFSKHTRTFVGRAPLCHRHLWGWHEPDGAPQTSAREKSQGDTPGHAWGPTLCRRGVQGPQGWWQFIPAGPLTAPPGPRWGGMLGIVGTLPARLWEPLSGKHCACASIQCAFIVLLLYAGHWGHALTEGTVPCATCQCEKSHRNINQPGAPRAVSHPRPRPAAAPTVQSCLPALTLCAVK